MQSCPGTPDSNFDDAFPEIQQRDTPEPTKNILKLIVSNREIPCPLQSQSQQKMFEALPKGD